MGDSQSAGLVLAAIGVTLAIYWYRLDANQRSNVWGRVTGK